MAEETDAVAVNRVSSGDGKSKAKTGKPRKITSSVMRSKIASFGGSSMGNAGSTMGSGGNFYSPELSTDFLELPQSIHEQWNYYRFFYKSEPFVGQAVDLHTELPISKIRIGLATAKNRDIAIASTRFCERWAQRINLLDRLISITHERNLLGIAYVWCEDTNPEMPQDVTHEVVRILKEDGEAEEKTEKREDADERAAKWLRKNYKGWTSIRCLPPEQVRRESFNFTDECIFELIPDSKTKSIIEKAQQGDKEANRIVTSMPSEVVNAVLEGTNIPLNTDPMAGSFIWPQGWLEVYLR